MIKPQEQGTKIASDTPQTDPAHDAFGYAPFAQRIADAVCEVSSPQGLVIAIHGPWGAGKTTLLNFVKYCLSATPEPKQPIIIDFNPWWFTSKEHLATQFLAQFRSKLICESELLRKAGDAMADYAGTIGKAVSLTYGIPWLDKLIGFLLKLFKRKQKNVPELKAEISDALKKGRRIVFFIDDIDRLAPNEVCELFKVIKALADFPNVIYVLSFDRNVVADALHVSLGIDGEAYLEKIVQAPFSLPTVDRIRLRKKLFTDLDEILESHPLPHFDQTYWANVYFEGLDQYIIKPRDVVRIINVLTVTYPAVAGEVNPVDFIAMEILRVFEPHVYATIRNNKDMFLKSSDSNSRHDKEPHKAFHSTWLTKVPAERQENVKRLVIRLFPKLAGLFDSIHYGSGDVEWRRKLRVCASEVFDTYFQFGVAAEVLSRAELDSLVSVGAEPEKVCAILEAAARIHRADGTSKARDILERLQDVTEGLSPEAATGILKAVLTVGDDILTPADEQEFFGPPNLWRLRWAVDHLLKRIPEDKEKLLLGLAAQGKAIALIVFIIETISDLASKQDQSSESPLAGIDNLTLTELKKLLSVRLASLELDQILGVHEFAYVVDRWGKWTDDTTVVEKLKPILASDDLLPALLEKYLRFSKSQSGDDLVVRRIPYLNPKQMESLTDLVALEPRVQKVLDRSDLSENKRIAAELFLKGMARVREGKNPDGYFSED